MSEFPGGSGERLVASVYSPTRGWGSAAVEVSERGVQILPGGHGEHYPAADFSLAPGFTDWHVHTSLFDFAKLSGTAVSRVLDLGANPERVRKDSAESRDEIGLEILWAGAFLAPKGGYPSDRDWAEQGSVREIASLEDAREAVSEQQSLGSRLVKITQNSVAGPTFDADLLERIVSIAHGLGLAAVVHAEGRGEAKMARLAGADILAHAPFSELLSAAEIRAQAERVAWISTVFIHGWGSPTPEHQVALENLSAFVKAGGRVLYGTDSGNGRTVIGLNATELQYLRLSGMSEELLIGSLTRGPGKIFAPTTTMVRIPGEPGALNILGASPVQCFA